MKNHVKWLSSIGTAALLALAVFFTACDSPLSLDEDSAARAVRTGTATFGVVTIDGTIGTGLSNQVNIDLVGNTFIVDEGTYVTSWFTNLPAGLTAQVAINYGPRVVIIINGTPQVVSAYYIRGTIPASALDIKDANITIAVNPNAKYDIRWPYTGWTQSANPALQGGSVNAAAYGNGAFVVGNRNNNTGAFSTNGGATWTQVQIFPVNAHVSSIVFIGGAFYAVGDLGTLSYSTDGRGWTLIAAGLLGGADIRTIAYGKGVTVIAGTNGQAAYTTGYPSPTSNWQPLQGISSTANFNSVVFGVLPGTNGVFVITGQNAVSGYSINGINWTPTSAQTQAIFSAGGSQSSIKMVAYDPVNSKFMIVGYHEVAYATANPNGISNWVGVDLTDIMGDTARTSWLNCVTYGDGYFVAGGSEGQSISSTDGINWGLTGAKDQFIPGADIPFVNAITYDTYLDKFLIAGGIDAGPGIGVYNN
jgi:hypothetical protein